jgi:hypothetical protein
MRSTCPTAADCVCLVAVYLPGSWAGIAGRASESFRFRDPSALEMMLNAPRLVSGASESSDVAPPGLRGDAPMGRQGTGKPSADTSCEKAKGSFSMCDSQGFPKSLTNRMLLKSWNAVLDGLQNNKDNSCRFLRQGTSPKGARDVTCPKLPA